MALSVSGEADAEITPRLPANMRAPTFHTLLGIISGSICAFIS